MSRVLRNALQLLRTAGVQETLRHAVNRASEHYHERRLGIRTAGYRKLSELGVHNPEFIEYAPVPYRIILAAMGRAPVDEESVFLNIGCGMGRPLAVAATLPFRRIIGVDIAPELLESARTNLSRLTDPSKCRDIELVCADAATYVPPDDVNFIYCANPFRGETLKAVIENIRRSLVAAPRKLTIVYVNPDQFAEFVVGADWIFEKEKLKPYLGFTCTVYESAQSNVTRASGGER